jgi:hypothetical protein
MVETDVAYHSRVERSVYPCCAAVLNVVKKSV